MMYRPRCCNEKDWSCKAIDRVSSFSYNPSKRRNFQAMGGEKKNSFTVMQSDKTWLSLGDYHLGIGLSGL